MQKTDQGFYIFKKDFITILIATFFCALIVYGYEVFNFSLSVDEEFLNNALVSVSFGRWGYYLLKFIFPYPYVPFATAIIALFFLAAAAANIAMLYKLDLLSGLTLGILSVSFPHFSYALQFLFQADVIAFGVFLGSCAALLFDKIQRGNPFFFLSIGLFIISTTFAISIYQSLLLVPIVLVFGLQLKNSLEARITFRSLLNKMVLLLVLIIISVILYFVISKIFLTLLSLEKSSYIDNLIGWKSDSIFSNLSLVIREIKRGLNGKLFYGDGIFPSVFIPIVITLILIKRLPSKVITILLITLLLFTPFTLSIILGKQQAARILFTLPISFAILWVILINRLRIKYYIYIAIMLISVMYGTTIASKLFYMEKLARDADTYLINRIISGIRQKYPHIDIEKTPILFWGSLSPFRPFKSLYDGHYPLNDTFGASYFEWDGGNPGRMIIFARVAAIANFVRANEDVELINSKFIRDLPAWPNLDSIQLSNENILIVKLSKEMSETHSNRFFEEIKIQPYDVTHSQ